MEVSAPPQEQPAKDEVEVHEGETLYSISMREGVSVTAIQKLNNIAGNHVKAGTVLFLRKKSSVQVLTSGVGKLSAGVEKLSTSGVDALSGMFKRLVSSDPNEEEGNSTAFPSLSPNAEERPRASSVPSLPAKYYSMDDRPRAGTVFTAVEEASSEPGIIGRGKILTTERAKQLKKIVPPSQQSEDFKLLFSLVDDGNDINTFYALAADYKYTLLLVETMDGDIFGGFNSVEWKFSPQFCKYRF